MNNFLVAVLSAVLVISMSACGSRKGKLDGGSENSGIDFKAELSGELNVTCYDTMFYKEFLDEAATAFEARYPGTKINVSSFSKMPEIKTMTNDDGSVVSVVDSGDESQAISDYINRTNTELMSGYGADILAMDVLPYYKYAESGALVDLSAYMADDKDFDIKDYKSNILEAVRYKGGTYTVPLDFGFEFITLSKDRAGAEVGDKLRLKSKFTYDEMIELSRERFAADGDARMIDFQGSSHAFRYLFKMNYGKFIDIENRKANFKGGDFCPFFEQAAGAG